MRSTDQTLMDQLRITPIEIERRKAYLNITQEDAQLMVSLRPLIADHIEQIVETFYKKILPFDEMDRVIGDSDTLTRLIHHQQHYVLSLFDGQYDEEYVHSRLRVGLVHRRIGLDPKFYVAAVHNLSSILKKFVVQSQKGDCQACTKYQQAIEKMLIFDLSLTVDTYINSLIAQVKRSREDLETYAESLEETIAQRTRSLKEMARHDGLTGLLNQHTFYKELRRELSRAKRQATGTVLVYFDLDGFKHLNDTMGHKAGDEALKSVAGAIKTATRENEIIARYGGDEFCVVLSSAGLDDGLRVAERLNQEIEAGTKETGISCSMGIAISTPAKPMDADTLVRQADAAMYEAKKETGFAIRIAKDLKSLGDTTPQDE